MSDRDERCESCEPCVPMQDTKESDLVTLEKKSGNTLRSIREVRYRLSKLVDDVRRVEPCENDCEKEIPVQPKNRIIGLFNCFVDIDKENEEMNALICDLEDILK